MRAAQIINTVNLLAKQTRRTIRRSSIRSKRIASRKIWGMRMCVRVFLIARFLSPSGIWRRDLTWPACRKIWTVLSWSKIDGKQMDSPCSNRVTMFFSPIQAKPISTGERTTLVCSFLFCVFRVILKDGSGAVIVQTNGTEKAYDTMQPKTVDPFLAYTPSGNVNSVSSCRRREIVHVLDELFMTFSRDCTTPTSVNYKTLKI